MTVFNPGAPHAKAEGIAVIFPGQPGRDPAETKQVTGIFKRGGDHPQPAGR